MTLIKVKLRVVGVYLNTPVELDDKGGGLTVKDVMDAYIAQHPITEIGGFDYSPQAGPLLQSVSHNFGGRYDYNGNGSFTDSVDGNSLGNNPISPGIYTLDGTFGNDVNLIWQYYVVAPSGRVKSKTPPSRKFNSFTDVPTNFQIKDKDTIIWRLVAIRKNP
ncbi:MAG: hypothetical protein MUF58_12555 [Arcicella sp.]|jgi:hypothetical protein|nr:hypothetical protein [Arcicella sp.]